MATGQSKLLSDEANPVWVVHEGKRRQTRSVGIRKRKTRRAGYVVEFRLLKSSTKEKIWAGTFESRPKAMRAFDVARHLVGMEPFYYVYPQGYLPKRPSLVPPEETVKRLAKQYADKPDKLSVNPSSLFPDTSTSAPARSPIARVGSHQPTTMPSQASNEVLEANLELKEVVAKVEPAYTRGLTAPNNSGVTDLLKCHSGECHLRVDIEFLNDCIPIEGGRNILDPIGDILLEPENWSDGSSSFPTTPENHGLRDGFVTEDEWNLFMKGFA